MKHKWTKLPNDVQVGMPVHFQWQCKTCGATKTLGNYKFATPSYERSSQTYDHYIECYDDELEKLKTID